MDRMMKILPIKIFVFVQQVMVTTMVTLIAEEAMGTMSAIMETPETFRATSVSTDINIQN